jgi:hypothetical protein
MMNFAALILLSLISYQSFGQTEATTNLVDNICRSIDSRKDTASFTFYEGDTLRTGEAGYRNVFITYRTDKKSKRVLYIKVWRNNETDNWSHEFYFQNGNLVKAIITGYAFSPTTTLYLWHNTLIAQEPAEPLFWKGFDQLGYCVHKVVARRILLPKTR